jgi:Protein of unknown function (DUF3017)
VEDNGVAAAVTEPIRPVGPTPPGDGPPPQRGGRFRGLRAQLAFVVVLLVAAVGIVRIGQYHWREGAALLGAALVLAAAFRTVLSDRRAGLLVVRGRAVDVLSYAALGALVLFVALTITGGPLG